MSLLTPQFINSQTYSAKQWRAANNALGRVQPGVWDTGEFTVAVNGGLTMSVGSGAAWIPAVAPNLGWYHVTNDATITGVAVGTAHATLPRLDQVCLRVNDATDGGAGASNAEIYVLAGTATSGADLDDRLGAATMAAGSIRLADVLVPAATGTLVSGNLRDRRPWARGAAARWYLTAADFTTTATSITAFSTLKRLELTGKPIRMLMTGAWSHSVVAAEGRVAIQSTTPGQPSTTFGYPDGRFYTHTFPVITKRTDFMFEHVWAPAAGSYLFRLAFMTTSGTLTVAADSTNTEPLCVSILEDPVVSGNNGIT